MKIQNIFSLLTLACFTGLPHALAEEGFTFTEEEVAAAEQQDAQRELQSMINDGALFLSKNRKAYQSIVSRSRTFADKYSELTTEKYHQATNFSQSPAELHTDIVDYFTGDMRFSPSAGQFLEGPLSHSTLGYKAPAIPMLVSVFPVPISISRATPLLRLSEGRIPNFLQANSNALVWW